MEHRGLHWHQPVCFLTVLPDEVTEMLEPQCLHW